MASSKAKDAARSVMQRALGKENYLFAHARWLLRGGLAAREPELAAFSKLVREGTALVDVGAGIGTTCGFLAREHPRSPVHAFEPHPLNRRVLTRVLRSKNISNVTVHAVAAGSQASTAEMVMPTRAGAALFGLTHVVQADSESVDTGETVRVDVVALDDYLPRSGLRENVGGLKIDVENFEFEALTGCRATLKEFQPPVLCELWDNENRTRVMSLFETLGYTCWVLHERRFVPYDGARHRALNFLFLPSGSPPP